MTIIHRHQTSFRPARRRRSDDPACVTAAISLLPNAIHIISPLVT